MKIKCKICNEFFNVPTWAKEFPKDHRDVLCFSCSTLNNVIDLFKKSLMISAGYKEKSLKIFQYKLNSIIFKDNDNQ